MTKFPFSTFLFFLSVLFPVNNWESSPAELMVQNGINSMYNYEFEYSISILDSAWGIDNTHPVTPFVLIAAKWLSTQTKDGYDASYDIINSEVHATAPIYKSLISQYPDKGEYYLYLGSTFGIRARTALAGKSWLDVLYFGYQGLKYIRLAQDIDETLLDIYMPIGLMEYFACLSLPPVKWGASFMGISTDCEEGLKHLEIAAKESHYSWIEASNVLAYAYLHIERDLVKAEHFISPLVDQFPGHPYFAFLKGEVLAKTKQWKALDELLPKLREFASKGPFLQKNECQLKLAYVEGLKSYQKEDYSSAISKCNWILNNYHMEFDWLKGFTYFLRAQSFEDLGKVESAINDYREVVKMDSYYPEVEEARENILRIASKE